MDQYIDMNMKSTAAHTSFLPLKYLILNCLMLLMMSMDSLHFKFVRGMLTSILVSLISRKVILRIQEYLQGYSNSNDASIHKKKQTAHGQNGEAVFQEKMVGEILQSSMKTQAMNLSVHLSRIWTQQH